MHRIKNVISLLILCFIYDKIKKTLILYYLIICLISLHHPVDIDSNLPNEKGGFAECHMAFEKAMWTMWS